MTRAPRRLDTLDNYFEDLVVGDTYETGERTVTPEDNLAFARLCGDLHPFHVDEEIAARSPIGSLFVSGAFTLAILTGLQFELMAAGNGAVRAGEGAVLAWYGLDRARFLKPVRVGDTLSVSGRISGLDDRGEPGSGLVTMDDQILRDGQEPVVVLTRTWVQRKRPPAS